MVIAASVARQRLTNGSKRSVSISRRCLTLFLVETNMVLVEDSATASSPFDMGNAGLEAGSDPMNKKGEGCGYNRGPY